MENISCINILTSAFTLISIIISLIYKMNGLSKRSIENIRKRFDIYEKIITNVKNKVLSYTYLKEYLGVPISDEMIKYILKSTNFYDFVVVWKNIYTYVDFDPKTKKIAFKRNKEPNRKLFVFFYFVFSIPFILFVCFFDKIIKNYNYLILSIIITIPSIIAAIFIWMEIGDRTLAINIYKKINNSNNGTYKQKK
jgi:hypothetical protein